MENGKVLRNILSPHWREITPKEIKIFLTLIWLADSDTGELGLSLFRLSQKTKIPVKKVTPFLKKLTDRGLITFKPGDNYFLDSTFSIPIKSFSDLHSDKKIDIDEILNIPINANQNSKTAIHSSKNRYNDIDINKININEHRSGTVKLKSIKNKKKQNDSESTVGKTEIFSCKDMITAEKIARTFDDEDNLGLFQSYINRYPKEVIQKAFRIVLNTPADQIKKSKGAYFNFLVQKFGRENN